MNKEEFNNFGVFHKDPSHACDGFVFRMKQRGGLEPEGEIEVEGPGEAEVESEGNCVNWTDHHRLSPLQFAHPGQATICVKTFSLIRYPKVSVAPKSPGSISQELLGKITLNPQSSLSSSFFVVVVLIYLLIINLWFLFP